MNNKHIPSKVGNSMCRMDALNKASGQEKFAADFYCDNMLWAGVKRAHIPHALLHDLEIEKAKKMPGVLAVLTHKDIKGTNRQGVVQKDQPVLVDDRIRHCGDAVALVIAEDKKILNQAISLISFKYTELQGVFDPEKALENDAPLIHEDHVSGNILSKVEHEQGIGIEAFKQINSVVEGCFDLPIQEHAYLETENGWAVLNQDGQLEITVSTQTPFRDRSEVAEALGLDINKVRIIAPYCGGAFGGKDGITVQSLLGLAALHFPLRPVKMWWSREESFIAGSKRHAAKLYYKLGALEDGRLHALDSRLYYDTGPYDHLGGEVMALGLEHAGGPYRIPNVRLRGWAVYTNNPVGGAFRGFGVPQVTAAMEQMMDMLAKYMDISSFKIRQINALQKGDKNPLGVTLTTSTGLIDCIEKLYTHPEWMNRNIWKLSAATHKVRGVGIACLMHGMGYGPVVPDIGNAKIELTQEGHFKIYCGVVDMGQGNISTYLQIASDILNQDIRYLEAILPDTERTLPSGSSAASRTTYTFGNALIGAAELLKKCLIEKATDLLMVSDRNEISIIPGKLKHLPTGQEISLSHLAKLLNDSERITTFCFQAPTAKENPVKNKALQMHGIPHIIFSYGVHAAFVEVDTLTGEIEIKNYLSISDCGKLINPDLFHQQMQGGIAQGIGYSLFENFQTREGITQTTDLSTYIIPGAMDIPDIISLAIQKPEHTGPFGLKGAGEIAIDGPLPAIANAISDATGIRFFKFPLTAELVLKALDKNIIQGEED